MISLPLLIVARLDGIGGYGTCSRTRDIRRIEGAGGGIHCVISRESPERVNSFSEIELPEPKDGLSQRCVGYVYLILQLDHESVKIKPDLGSKLDMSYGNAG